MAFYYKTVVRYQKVDYDFTQARENSREAYILAFDKGASLASSKTVATINNKTKEVTYHKELPTRVKNAVENFVNS